MRKMRTIAVLALLALCAACTRQSPRLEQARTVAGGKAEHGPAAMRAYGCGGCHTIPGVRGADALVGPPLTAWGKRRFIAGRVPNEPHHLVEWILHPQGIKPGTAMPDMGVKDADAHHIAAYLYTLK